MAKKEHHQAEAHIFKPLVAHLLKDKYDLLEHNHTVLESHGIRQKGH
jgi:hypothetical protein